MKKKILVVIANYYTNIADELLKSALNELKNIHQTKIINVPGVFEIPVTISKFIKKFDAAIALGCVIKGETPHFDFISSATTDAIMKISIDSKKPVGNGVITCLNKKQAIARSSINNNKGKESAKALISLFKI